MTDYLQLALLMAILTLLIYEHLPKLRAMSGTNRKLMLDTCALIDGRIVDLVTSGFIHDELVVPQFVLTELQQLADGNDAQKRERARFGLDVVQQLQACEAVTVAIDRTKLASIPEVDDKLIKLSKNLGATLYTTDFNLIKVATIEGVKILNVNELAQQLRPEALPGEIKSIKILQKGNNRNQGVGYLDDGTMVVVDGAARMQGRQVQVEVNRMHQTVAGKMIFATISNKPAPRS